MPDEGSAINHTTEEEMDVCKGQIGKYPGGRPKRRGTGKTGQ